MELHDPRRCGGGGGGGGGGRVDVGLDMKYLINNDDDDRLPDDDNGPVVQRDINESSVLGDAPSPSAVPGLAPPPGSALTYDNRGGGIISLSSSFGQPSDGGGRGGNRNSNNHNHGSGGGGMITFESMYHFSPMTMWRESHLHDLGSDILAHHHPSKTNAMMHAKS